jgi:formylmethanofuran dehydrogenase subunit A
MAGIILKNGTVYDPANNVNGEKMDIHIKDGKVVENAGRTAKKINCQKKTVMPGAVEIHSHIAGGKVNCARLLRPEDHVKKVMAKTKLTRAGSGFSTPSTFMTGYLYSKLGYTTAMTAAMVPLTARHTHEELEDTPMLDKGAYTLMDGNWFLMRYLKDGDFDKAAAYTAWLLKVTKGMVIKLTNPGGTEAWGWGKNCKSLDDPVPYFDITPREIIRGMVEVNEMLDLPHSVHLHANNLGRLGNYETTIDTLEVPKGTKNKERQILHATHVQFHSYGGDSWKNFESEAESVAKAVNKSDTAIIDTGNVTLDNTTTMTADGPMEYYLQSLTHLKWMNRDVELETAPGITPFVYSPKMPTAAIQWAIGLELGLLIKDPWKVLMTTDHPNGGPFTRYPSIIAWLMSKPYRDEMVEKINKAAGKRSSISGIEREYDFNEIAVITRAGQARSLGLSETKGHLGIGADGDVAVYDIDPANIDPGRQFKEIEKAFSATAYTIKGGEIVVKDGEIAKVVYGKTFWANSQVDEKLADEVLSDVEYNFKRYYSVNLANYPVQDKYVKRPHEIKIDARDVGA